MLSDWKSKVTLGFVHSFDTTFGGHTTIPLGNDFFFHKVHLQLFSFGNDFFVSEGALTIISTWE